jgi:TonB family protein
MDSMAQYQRLVQSASPQAEAYASLVRQYEEAAQRYQDLLQTPTGPSLISRRNPDYTPEARASGIQGTVELAVTIGADGLARDFQVTRSLDAGLDQKAIECVKEWRFRPVYRNGQPVTAFASVEVVFRLQ